MSRFTTLAAASAGLAVGAVLLAGPALAHVTVTAPGATSGGSDQEITFRVPVEKTIDTTGLTVQLPTDTPIASVLVEPIPGWTHTQVTSRLAKPIVTDDGDITEAVTRITWTATAGHGLEPGEFGAFTIIAGQLPDASTLTFKALQTYSDGSVVRWIQVAAPGATDEPADPAPVLTLAASGSAAATPSATVSAVATTASTSDTGPVVLSIVALVVAVAALGLVVVSRARSGGSTRRANPGRAAGPMRLAWPAFAAGVAVTVLGAAGLVRAAVPQSTSSGGHASTSTAPIVVTGAYVTAPLPPTHVSAAYFTVHNTTATPDRLVSVSTGAGPTAVLHLVARNGAMVAMGSGVTVPAHGTLVLRAGQCHVMIEGVYPSVQVGQSVNIDLEFDNAGPVDVLAPVVRFGDTAATPSGAHS